MSTCRLYDLNRVVKAPQGESAPADEKDLIDRLRQAGHADLYVDVATGVIAARVTALQTVGAGARIDEKYVVFTDEDAADSESLFAAFGTAVSDLFDDDDLVVPGDEDWETVEGLRECLDIDPGAQADATIHPAIPAGVLDPETLEWPSADSGAAEAKNSSQEPTTADTGRGSAEHDGTTPSRRDDPQVGDGRNSRVGQPRSGASPAEEPNGRRGTQWTTTGERRGRTSDDSANEHPATSAGGEPGQETTPVKDVDWSALATADTEFVSHLRTALQAHGSGVDFDRRRARVKHVAGDVQSTILREPDCLRVAVADYLTAMDVARQCADVGSPLLVGASTDPSVFEDLRLTIDYAGLETNDAVTTRTERYLGYAERIAECSAVSNAAAPVTDAVEAVVSADTNVYQTARDLKEIKEATIDSPHRRGLYDEDAASSAAARAVDTYWDQWDSLDRSERDAFETQVGTALAERKDAVDERAHHDAKSMVDEAIQTAGDRVAFAQTGVDDVRGELIDPPWADTSWYKRPRVIGAALGLGGAFVVGLLAFVGLSVASAFGPLPCRTDVTVFGWRVTADLCLLTVG
ncbi:hypothetical protein [Halorubrum lipolyticum]|uniref:Uncharacterized protein n=1 Tax=Halorubrum lipolyticum DSM 21995 TaxID=1227482 RepID=M0NNV6_9EURY|nr:hypothetical protein [Halorubrum lipolyticum]EMA59612.1 hypothetical protein C469_09821 [Halorubrum lipolyticum DSM 21995]